MTALLVASHHGQIEVVRLLLEHGAGIEAKDQVSAIPAVHVGYGVCN
jgi:ankyrin repeat protein